jgi:hypothetical protein
MITTEDGDVAIGHPSILLLYPRLFCALQRRAIRKTLFSTRCAGGREKIETAN